VSKKPRTLWIGDLCCTESRLAVQTLGIKGVCTIASHGIDELWAADGVRYMTAIVTPTSSLSEQLEACISFLDSHTPAVVCCSSGIGASALVAAAFLIHSQPSLEPAKAIEAVRQATVGGGRLDLSEEDLGALQRFATSVATSTPPAAPSNLGVTPTGGSIGRPLPPSPVADKKATKEGVPRGGGGGGDDSARKRARRGIGTELTQEMLHCTEPSSTTSSL